MADPLAHSGGHLLADHLQCVADLAGKFSEEFDAVEAARSQECLAGLLHV